MKRIFELEETIRDQLVTREKFVLELCKILRLDYVEADEYAILEAVRALKNHTLPEFSGGLIVEQDTE